MKFNKARKILNLIWEQFFGNEIVPILISGYEAKVDLSTKDKALEYLEKVSQDDKYAISALLYLKTLSNSEYKELLDFAIGEIEQ